MAAVGYKLRRCFNALSDYLFIPLFFFYFMTNSTDNVASSECSNGLDVFSWKNVANSPWSFYLADKA